MEDHKTIPLMLYVFLKYILTGKTEREPHQIINIKKHGDYSDYLCLYCKWKHSLHKRFTYLFIINCVCLYS